MEEGAREADKNMKECANNGAKLLPCLDKNRVNENHENLTMDTDQSSQISNLCYNEVRRQGSCTFGATRCRYSHEIPANVKQNKEVALNIIGQRNLCVNQFFEEGSCQKGDHCRFHHVITDEQRKDPNIIEIMKGKQRRIYQQRERSNAPLCVYEFEYWGACRRKDECTFNHDISEAQRGDSKLADEIKSKRTRIYDSRKQRQNRMGLQKREEENVAVPKKMLEQMYQMIEQSSGEKHF